MPKIKLIILNVICIFLLSFFTFLSWQYLVIGTQYFMSDYKTFQKTLSENQLVYKKNNYVFLAPEKKGSFKRVGPMISSINFNTPALNFFLKKLVNVSKNPAKNILLWILASFICGAISLFVLMRWLSSSYTQFYFFCPLLLIFSCNWFFVYNNALGQVTLLLLPFFCLIFFLDEKKYLTAMAILLAFLSALKLFFLLFFLIFVVRRQWRLLFLFIISFLFFFFFPLIYFSSHDYSEFFKLLNSSSVFIFRSIMPMNGSFLGVIANIVLTKQLHTIDFQVQAAVVILSLFFVVRWLIYDYRFLRHLSEFVNGLRYSFLMVIALLCSPLGWAYYFLFLLIPVFVFYKISVRYALPKLFFVFLILALTLPYWGWLHSSEGVWSKSLHYPVFLSLLCWLACAHLAAVAVFFQHPAVLYQKKLYVAIFAAGSLLSIVLLSFNFGIPHFLDGKQLYYNKKMPMGAWVDESKVKR